MCPPLGNCDFDQMSMCSWTQGMKEDDFDWTLGSGNTPGFNTGPSVDHSSNSSTGKPRIIFVGFLFDLNSLVSFYQS